MAYRATGLGRRRIFPVGAAIIAMWEELGIVPTGDPKAIRRAYAGPPPQPRSGSGSSRFPALAASVRGGIIAGRPTSKSGSANDPRTPTQPTHPKERLRANAAAARYRSFPSQDERRKPIAADRRQAHAHRHGRRATTGGVSGLSQRPGGWRCGDGLRSVDGRMGAGSRTYRGGG